MKKFIIIFCFFFIHFNFAHGKDLIVFVDLNKIMTTSKPGSSLLEQLNKKNNQIFNSFKEDEKKLKDKEDKLIAQKKILSEDEFQSNVSKLKIEIDKYNINTKNVINDFNALRKEATDIFMEKINSTLINYSNEKSISMIFAKKNMIIGKSELDITGEIIKRVNSEMKEFKIK